MKRPTSFKLAVVVCGISGCAALLIASGWDTWVLFVHGASGFAAVFLAPWRDIADGSRFHRVITSATVVTVVGIVATGLLHTTGIWTGRGRYGALTFHIVAAFVFVVVGSIGVVVGRVWRRPQEPERADTRGRRDVLQLGIGVGAAFAVRGVVEGVIKVAHLSGASRRFTGSFEVASLDPENLPVTYWFGDRTPSIDEREWQLVVRSGSRMRRWTYAQLERAGENLTATIDCSGGWYSKQLWTGITVDQLVDGMPGRTLRVRSVAGYWRAFPRREAPHLLLALRIGGEPLTPQHGFPARLVAPGRRGFWWVKWVNKIEVTDGAAWWQPPIPLQ